MPLSFPPLLFLSVLRCESGMSSLHWMVQSTGQLHLRRFAAPRTVRFTLIHVESTFSVNPLLEAMGALTNGLLSRDIISLE
jgi:hypothetical protein